MSWEQILGFFAVWMRPEITVWLWYSAGVPIWQTLGYAVAWTSITLTLTYFSMDAVKIFVRLIFGGILWIIKCFKKEFGRPQKNNGRPNGKFVDWLSRQRKWVVLALGSLPLPFFPTAVVIATKTIKIRHGLLLLLVGNALRNWFVCTLVYYLGINIQDLLRFFY